MREFQIGKFIKEQRIKKGITQIALSFDLCNPSTLSRIEAGTQIPSPQMLKIILERLGFISERYHDLRGLIEFEMEELKNEIKNANSRNDFKEAIRLRNTMTEKFDCSSATAQQFLKWTDAINGRIVDGNVVRYSDRKRLEMLTDAIKLTSPQFNINNIKNCLLGLNEIIIAINIANTYDLLGERQTALDLYENLLKYTKRHLLDLSEGALIIPLLAYNYSATLEDEKLYDKELEIAQHGIDCCIKYKRMKLFGELMMNKAVALHELDYHVESKETAIQCYYVLKSLRLHAKADITKKYLLDTYNYSID